MLSICLFVYENISFMLMDWQGVMNNCVHDLQIAEYCENFSLLVQNQPIPQNAICAKLNV